MILPAGDIAFGTSIAAKLAFLEKSQWWSLKEVQAYQNKNLREMLNHAYNNVPYYHKLFKEKGLSPKSIKSVNLQSR